MLVVSSPSGAGKTTLTRNLLAQEKNISLSVSVTTRARRPSEIERRALSFHLDARVRGAARRRRVCSNGPRCTAIATARRASRSRPRSPPDTTCCSTSTGRARSSSMQTMRARHRQRVRAAAVGRRAQDAAGAARGGQRGDHRTAAAQRRRGDRALERIRLRAGQSTISTSSFAALREILTAERLKSAATRGPGGLRREVAG